jgi:hypothetical protein
MFFRACASRSFASEEGKGTRVGENDLHVNLADGGFGDDCASIVFAYPVDVLHLVDLITR